MTVLETERLRLRPLALDDEEELYAVFADPYARQFYPEMIDRQRVRQWIAWNLRNYEEYGFGLWGLELKSSGRLIGDCGLTFQKAEDTMELEVGYHVVASERRKGYASEAARACLDYGFQQTSRSLICSIVRPTNVASCGVAARLHAGCREIMRKDRPALLYFTERTDWEHQTAGA